MINPYTTLGVPYSATDAEIKAAYRRLASQHHPDKGTDSDGETMAAINKAYALLNDAARRSHFDRTGSTQPVPDLENEARSILSQAFSNVLANSGDVVLEARHQITRNMHECDKLITQIKQRIKNIEDNRSRVSCTGPANLLAQLTEAALSTMHSDMSAIQSRRTVCVSALAMLNDYNYQSKEPVPFMHIKYLLEA